MKPVIEVIVATDGGIAINAIAFKGADCEKATKYLEEALGAVGRKVKKPEYHQAGQRHQTQRT